MTLQENPQPKMSHQCYYSYGWHNAIIMVNMI